MTEKLNLTGRCMCGAVKFTATAKEPDVAACPLRHVPTLVGRAVHGGHLSIRDL